MKKCSKCLYYLDETSFSFRKGKLQPFCKDCQNEYSKKYRSNNKESCNNNLKEWRKNNTSERILTDKQKEEENFRAKMRHFSKTYSTIPHPIFGYSSRDLRLLADPSAQQKPFIIQYKKPLKEFNLKDPEEQKKAASLDNLILTLK